VYGTCSIARMKKINNSDELSRLKDFLHDEYNVPKDCIILNFKLLNKRGIL